MTGVMAMEWWRDGYVETMGWVLVHSLWELAAAGVLTGAVLGACRRKSAGVRYGVCGAGLMVMVVAVGVTFGVMRPVARELPVVVPMAAKAEAMTARGNGVEGMMPAQVAGVSFAVTEKTVVESGVGMKVAGAIAPWLPWAVMGWLMGTVVLTLRLVGGFWRLGRLGRQGRELGGAVAARAGELCEKFGIKRGVRLIESALVEVPTVMGEFKPVILLPVSALTGLSGEQLTALLAHELAHVRRHDYLVNVAQTVVETVLFYHPAVWFVSERMRQEREHCCDDVAVAAAGDRVGYAQALAAMEGLRGVRGGLAMGARGGALLPRIKRILGVTPVGSPRRVMTTAVAAVLIMAAGAGVYVGCNRSAGTSEAATGTAVSASTQPIVLEAVLFDVPLADWKQELEWEELRLSETGDVEGGVRQTVLASPGRGERIRLADALREMKGVTVMGLPKLVLMSGQEKKVASTQPVYYVKGFQEVGEGGATVKVPQRATLETGFTVEMSAMEEHGRVRMAIHPKWTRLEGMDTFTTGPSKEDPRKTGEPYAQVPKTTTVEYRAAGEVPDDGALVVEGPTMTVEREMEDAVPGLSRLPGIGGAFRNHSYVKEERKLVMIVRATTQDVAAVPGTVATTREAGSEELPLNARAAAMKDVNEKVRAVLEGNLREIIADRTGLEKVLSLLKDNMDVNMVVDWEALKRVGVERDSPVTVRLKEIPFRKALTTALATVEGGERLAYAVEDGVLMISTKEALEASKKLVVQVYDIRDMLVVPSAAGDMFSQLAWASAGHESPAAMREKQRAETIAGIMNTIKSTVAPDSWKETGGTQGSIRELNGQLIVSQTAENQAAIRVLLEQLRETRGIQVAVEARMYLVDDATFAGLGLGASSGPVDGTSKAFREWPSKELGTKLLDDKQLAEVLAHLDKSPNMSSMTAPRVTLFNGQEGNISATNQQNYVAGTKASTDAAGRDAQELDIKTLTMGVVLNVSGTVAADRRSVAMTVHPVLRALQGFETVETLPATEREGGGLKLSWPFAQLPKLSETEVNTMMAVPEGKTWMLGGMKWQGEFPVGKGANVVGWQVATGASEKEAIRNLVVLVRPQIIVPKE
jgi:type II secretory pathway component GspD/PulD (secretin)